MLEPQANPGVVAPQPGPAAAEQKGPAPVDDKPAKTEALDQYGDMIPFADPAWYQSVSLIAFVYKIAISRNQSNMSQRSTILLTTTNHTQTSARKFDHTSMPRSNPMSTNGTKPRRYPTRSTKTLASAATSPA